VTQVLTTDAFFKGALTVCQHQSGYRFSIDAVLLAHFVVPKAGAKIVDLGTGCGIVALLLAFRHDDVNVKGVEIQPDLAALAKRNVANNHLEARVGILQQDLKALSLPQVDGPVDWVISNPPYRQPSTGRLCPDPERAIARHELKVGLTDLLAAARRVLRTGGRFAMIYIADRLVEVLGQMSQHGIEPKRLRMVQSKRHSSAKLFLVEGIKGAGRGMVVKAPLVVYRDDGEYRSEIARMFA
jgi:tRNA1Val (adenine37-N6)-methyltransferase